MWCDLVVMLLTLVVLLRRKSCAFGVLSRNHGTHERAQLSFGTHNPPGASVKEDTQPTMLPTLSGGRGGDASGFDPGLADLYNAFDGSGNWSEGTCAHMRACMERKT